MLSAWVANRSWVEANLPTAQRFVTAIRETAEWADRHQSESAAILSKHTRLAQEVIESMRRDPFALKTEAGTIQPIIDVCAKYNLIPRRFPVSELLVPNLI
jgi:ABC-type nitrate/sulfonate/bicarbonate transport system substrate-binding protein